MDFNEANKLKKDSVFIFLITGDFENFHRKSLIINFSNYIKNSPIIVINRPVDLIVTPIKKAYKFKEPQFEKYKETNILLLNPIMPVHERLVINFPKLIKKINLLFFKKQINHVLNKYRNFRKIVWIMHPDLIDYLDFFEKDFIIYDCYDEFLVKNAVNNIQGREEKLANISNLVVTSSKYLKEKKEKKYNIKNIMYSPTAIDINLFAKLNVSESIPEDIKNISHPIIGFAGSFRDDIDTEIVKYIAQKKPQWNLVFVGTIYSKIKQKKLSGFNNIYFLGHKPIEEFPTYLSNFDIAICPQILSDIIISSSPYKIYQYLALDLDVVTTAFPEALDISRKVSVANSKEAFLQKIEEFLNFPEIPLNYEERYRLSWEERFDKIICNLK